MQAAVEGAEPAVVEPADVAERCRVHGAHDPLEAGLPAGAGEQADEAGDALERAVEARGRGDAANPDQEQGGRVEPAEDDLGAPERDAVARQQRRARLIEKGNGPRLETGRGEYREQSVVGRAQLIFCSVPRSESPSDFRIVLYVFAASDHSVT